MKMSGRSFQGLNDRGAAMMLVIMLLSLLIFIPIGMQMSRQSFKEVKLQLHMTAQADNAARAGIEAALSWFKQKTGGVSNKGDFKYDDEAFRPTESKDTIDPDRGLVWEFPLEKGLIARYEVPRQRQDPSSYPLDPQAAHDVSAKRNYPLDRKGMAWTLQSIGFIYKDKNNSSVYFDPAKDQVMAKSHMTSEFRRLDLNLPYPKGAALITEDADKVFLDKSCNLLGLEQPGLVYYDKDLKSAYKDKVSGSVVTTKMPGTANASIDFSVTSLFSVPNARELALVADAVIDNVTDLNNASLTGLVVVNAKDMKDKTVTFNAAKPFSGAGLMYVDGNMVVEGVTGKPSTYNGVLIVTGDLTMTAPATVMGAVMAKGKVSLIYSNEGVKIACVQDEINRVKDDLLQYRKNKASVRIYSGKQQ
jgi:hypothetical protein